MTTRTPQLRRRLAVGAELLGDSTASVRVWTPKRSAVELCIIDGDFGSIEPQQPVSIDELPAGCEHRAIAMQLESDGYFSAIVDRVSPGALYGFRLDADRRLLADPASRFQPLGPCGPSQLVDPGGFKWSDDAWPGLKATGQVVYEMHIGTFTQAGTWAAATEQLAELKDAGFTVLEVMPVADFPGRFGWGYDGVAMFSPTRLYGEPDDFRRFVDRAHAVGLGVILDVVFNHFGNFGNYLFEFSQDYYTDRYQNEWASAINFDGPKSAPVREFFIGNARYWVEEYHLDGFRYDATQCVFDASPRHIIAEATAAACEAAGRRTLYNIAENEPQDIHYVYPLERHGQGLDGLWNDDFHHTAMVRLTGKSPAYYSDYRGNVEELIAAVKRGFIYQGQRSQWQQNPRGSSTRGVPAWSLVTFLQNHDQVANSPTGERCHQLSTAGSYRAMTALWLLSPQTPLFFQGQEFASSAPFHFFADFQGCDGEAISRGRFQFLGQFPEMRLLETQRRMADPRRRETFERCRLDFGERETHREIYDLHRDLLRMRRDDPIFARQRWDLIDAVALSRDCLVVRYFGDDGDDRLLIVNFGRDLLYTPAPEPLLAPPTDRDWSTTWSTDDPRYGGNGLPALEIDAGWRIPGQCAAVLVAAARDPQRQPEPGCRTNAECKEFTTIFDEPRDANR